MITCCKDCKKRFPGCHDYCETYLEEKEEHEQVRMKARREKDADNDFYGVWMPKRKNKGRMR